MANVSDALTLVNASCPTALYHYEESQLAGVTLLLLFIVCGTIFGNILVFLSLLLVKKLRTPSNLLLLSLSVSDLSIALTVEPFALYKTVNVSWELSRALCQIYLFLDVMLCTASILNLNAITIDRYLVITCPFQYSVRRTPRLMATFIACVWLTSIAVSSAAFAWPPSDQASTAADCYYTQELSYQMFSTVAAFYLPLIVMLTLWARIFVIARKMANADRVQQCRVQHSAPTHSPAPAPIELRVTANNHASQSDPEDPPDQSNGVSSPCNCRHLANNHANESSPIERRGSYPAQVINAHNNLSPCHTEPLSVVALHCSGSAHSPIALSSDEQLDDNSNGYAKKTHLTCDSKISPCLHRARPSATLSLLSTVTAVTTKRKAASSENKALITIATIMTCFTLCWLPFFLYAFVNPIYAQLVGCDIDIGHHGRVLLLWLGYANSFMNPIIYCKFNRDFRRPFIEFLKCHCRDVNARLRIEQYAEQYGVAPAVSSPSIHKAGLGLGLGMGLGPGNTAVSSPTSTVRVSKKARNRRLLDASLTRRQAEEAGLLTPCTKRSKIPKEHLLIVHHCAAQPDGNGNNEELCPPASCESANENPLAIATD